MRHSAPRQGVISGAGGSTPATARMGDHQDTRAARASVNDLPADEGQKHGQTSIILGRSNKQVFLPVLWSDTLAV
jgi:hypothetical protein